MGIEHKQISMSYFRILILTNMETGRELKKIGRYSAKYIKALEIISGRNVHICRSMGYKLQNIYKISAKYFASTYLYLPCITKLHVSVSKNHRQLSMKNLYKEVGMKNWYNKLRMRNL